MADQAKTCERCLAKGPMLLRLYGIHESASVTAGYANLPDFGMLLCLDCIKDFKVSFARWRKRFLTDGDRPDPKSRTKT